MFTFYIILNASKLFFNKFSKFNQNQISYFEIHNSSLSDMDHISYCSKNKMIYKTPVAFHKI